MPPITLITGAAGFIGSNLSAYLVKLGHRVIAVDNLSYGYRRNLTSLSKSKLFSFHEIDCRDRRKIAPLIAKSDTTVHLAAFKIPRYGGRRKMIEVNLDATRTVMTESEQRGSGHFILASTSDIYGLNPNIPFSESSESHIGPSRIARWSYAISKLCDEHLAWGFMEEGNLKPVVLRFFGSYGPNENRTWWGGPQSVFIERSLRNQALEIHGDGTQTRTFCFIDDLVNGIELAISNEAAIGSAWNLGGTDEITILELAYKIWSATGNRSKTKLKMIPYNNFKQAYQDVKRRVPDLSASKKNLGYVPSVSLDEGLRKTIAWHRRFYR